jgi:predicted AlkP superfamily pyrophosphatase or phosphodiesterase
MPCLLVSIDGLHPSDYLADHRGDHRASGPPAQTLGRLAASGGCALRAPPVYPSVTVTNHVSLVTGVHSARHGVLANTVFDPARVTDWVRGESVEWYFDAWRIRVPTLWEEARARGLRVASVRWPSSRGAAVDWLVPEVFRVGSSGVGWEEVWKAMDPRLVGELKAVLGDRDPRDHAEGEEWALRATAYLIERYRPDLTLVHLAWMDHQAHEHGWDSPERRAALARTDARLGEFLDRLDPAEWRVLVTGDHGFADFDRRLQINALLAEAGWLDAREDRIVDWRAVAQTNCGQAAVYLRPGLGELAERRLGGWLREACRGRARVLDRRELRAWRAFPDAAFAVDAAPGYSLGQALGGPGVQPVARRGEHGYLPDRPGLETGWIVAGSGIPAGWRVAESSVLAVAPTLASWLGLSLPAAEHAPIAPPMASRIRSPR